MTEGRSGLGHGDLLAGKCCNSPGWTNLQKLMLSISKETFAALDCEVRFDNLTRQLYATDASIYQIEPAAVAFPRTAEQASAVIRSAADAGISITPRGAGTSLSGGAIGDGIIVDFSPHNRQITELNIENGSVRVGAGVVLD